MVSMWEYQSQTNTKPIADLKELKSLFKIYLDCPLHRFSLQQSRPLYPSLFQNMHVKK